MPTVEDYFDDDTDLPLPSSSSKPRGLQGSGLQGALLEEIGDNDMDMEMDYDKLADQGRGIYGEGTTAPPVGAGGGGPGTPRLDKGKMTARDDEMRPSGTPSGQMGGMPNFDPNSPMGGFMGDMMKLQQAEDDRMERLKKQFGSTKIADSSTYKHWKTVYPLYFDAKVSVQDGRRVPRKDALWWPQATQIAKACRALLLPSVLEPDHTHPSDWENPGRVKVLIESNGKFVNPIIKNRTQLYKHLAAQLQTLNPSLKYVPPIESAPTVSAPTEGKKVAPKGKKGGKNQKSKSGFIQPRFPSRPPRPTVIPILDDRLPLNTPMSPTGVAIASVKRDLEAEKENKKKGIMAPGGSGEGEGKEGKMPKMKRVVVRGKR